MSSLISQSGKRDSNSRPQPWQGCALPTELFPHYVYLQTLLLCECKYMNYFFNLDYLKNYFFVYNSLQAINQQFHDHKINIYALNSHSFTCSKSSFHPY